MVVDTHVESYLAKVVEAVEGIAPVAGAFVLGSALLGGFDPEASDLDAVVVVERPLADRDREALVAELDRLPQPFRKLELVVYAEGAKPPGYELNYPDGPGEPAFWFVLDAAIAQERSESLRGRPWLELLEPVTEDETRRAAQESIRWADERGDEFGRLHAARARHYLDHGEWITKKEAGR